MTEFKGNNRATTIIDGKKHFILHQTSIAIHDTINDKITLSNGGFKTNVTKKALNEVGNILGFNVVQIKGKWIVSYKGDTIPFEDGMIL